MSHAITYVPGILADVYGKSALPDILTAAGADLEWHHMPWMGRGPSPEWLKDAERNDAILMAHQSALDGGPPPIVQLRDAYNCFANLRPILSVPGVESRFDNVDLLVVRESTEDVYAQLEHESIPGVFESLKVTTRSACERIAHHAFQTAQQLGRKKVTIVHKANIMKKSDGMFLATARSVSEQYPDIETEDCIVDALCMKLILHPEWFDVLLCGNLFGDIVADLCTGLVGGRANAPSANIGQDIAIFTTGHRSPTAEDTGLLFSAALMLRHLDQHEAADRLMTACESALATHPDALIPAIRQAL